MSHSSNLAYIVGKIMGDGHLEKTLGSCFFIDGSEESLIRMKNLLIHRMYIDLKALGLKKSLSSKGTSYKLRVSSVEFCRKLHRVGAPAGNKTSFAFDVPFWIYSDRNFAKSFLQGILEDELTTIKIESGSHSVVIQFKMSKHKDYLLEHLKFMQKIKLMVESFSVDCSHVLYFKSKEKDKFEVYFRIQRNKANLLRFKENIGFKLNRDKIKSLKECCVILKKRLKPKINIVEILDLSYSGRSIREISTITKVNRSTVHRIIQKDTLINKY